MTRINNKLRDIAVGVRFPFIVLVYLLCELIITITLGRRCNIMSRIE